MTSNVKVTDRFFQEAWKSETDARFLSFDNRGRNSVYPGRTSRFTFLQKNDAIPWALFSYGKHYPLAVPVTFDYGGELHPPNHFWLLNGDRVSVTTAKHQNMVQEFARRSREPFVIIPFSALRAAGIAIDTIELVDVRDEQWETRDFIAETLAEVPETHRDRAAAYHKHTGVYAWQVHEHFLGAALFRAHYVDGDGWKEGYFVSAFDENEPIRRRHYYLCQLPHGAPRYSDALRIMRPEVVRKADEAGIPVVRQGDIFAIETELSTRFVNSHAVKKGRWSGVKPCLAIRYRNDWGDLEEINQLEAYIPGMAYGTRPTDEQMQQFVALWNFFMPLRPVELVKSSGYDRDVYAASLLLGSRHSGTEVVELEDGTVLARGMLRHPEHVRQPLGRRWHQIVKNTVPEGRAWSQVGSVD